MKNHKKSPHMITFILLVVGGLNWLVFGIFQWEIGALFGGSDTIIARVIYILVGLSAVYELATHKKNCRTCNKKGEDGAPIMPSQPPQQPPPA